MQSGALVILFRPYHGTVLLLVPSLSLSLLLPRVAEDSARPDVSREINLAV